MKIGRVEASPRCILSLVSGALLKLVLQVTTCSSGFAALGVCFHTACLAVGAPYILMQSCIWRAEVMA